ncbi:ATP-binding cassette domain-containing protein [Plantactinospora sp. KBS50]|uniref:ATP-binding cassette domain-containing protein n=1 Tax=Plantactinospora sp. KBS50 TaxID=2024580 RepID=UPI0018DF5CD4|nr:ATP-binding cassette domain-containing protein [Plantactinospora sp. KBS50]
MTADAVLSVEALVVEFRRRGRRSEPLRALSEVSLEVRPEETLALVGESGSGKTTLGRVLVGLQKPTGGKVRLHGAELGPVLRREFRRTRRKLQIIFQDPNGSLTPWQKIGDAIAEPLLVHGLVPDRRAAWDRVASLLDLVGLRPEHASRYPREFSGGQRQRIAIARALALEPEILVCDEITSGLDASVQARVINLLSDLRRQRRISYVFITHDLHVARTVSDRIAVMAGGRIVELGDAAEVFDRPQHPYTRRLLAAQPTLPAGNVMKGNKT